MSSSCRMLNFKIPNLILLLKSDNKNIEHPSKKYNWNSEMGREGKVVIIIKQGKNIFLICYICLKHYKAEDTSADQ